MHASADPQQTHPCLSTQSLTQGIGWSTCALSRAVLCCRWSKVQDQVAGDPRAAAVPREEREGVFDKLVADLAAREQREEAAERTRAEAARRAEAQGREAEERRK